MEDYSTYDVPPHLYAGVIRELIRHENDVTNHRIMWLLILQGLLATAYAGTHDPRATTVLPLVGILVALSAFVILYKSYQARGYLQFLGAKAKQGKLPAEHLWLDGWPSKRIKDWRKDRWLCPWLRRTGDALEPYLFLPALMVSIWVTVLLERNLRVTLPLNWGLAAVLTILLLSLFCVVWVWSQKTDEKQELPRS